MQKRFNKRIIKKISQVILGLLFLVIIWSNYAYAIIDNFAIGTRNYYTWAEAHNAAVSGDVISIYPSKDITESLTITKNITLDGGVFQNHTIRGNYTATPVITIKNAMVTLKNVNIQGQNNANKGIVIIEDAGFETNVLITSSNIGQTTGSGIFIENAHNVTINACTINYNFFNGINVQNRTSVLSIINNNIKDNGTGGITDNAYGIYIKGCDPQSKINFNNIINNGTTSKALYYEGSSDLDASLNWWGATTNAGARNVIYTVNTNKIIYDPILLSSYPDAATANVNTKYFFLNGVGYHNFNDAQNAASFLPEAERIIWVTANVQVTTSIQITTNLTLIGKDKNSSAIVSTGNTIINIDANSVTISSLIIRGNDYNASGIYLRTRSNGFYTIRDNIITGNYQSIYIVSVYTYPASVIITGNEIIKNSYGIYTDSKAVNLRIEENTISQNYHNALFINNSGSLNLSGNKIVNNCTSATSSDYGNASAIMINNSYNLITDIASNNISNNGLSSGQYQGIYISSLTVTINAVNNWWGTANAETVAKMFYPTANIIYNPFLLYDPFNPPIRYISIANGSWNSASIWDKSEVPPLFSTVLIEHNVMVPGDFAGNTNGDCGSITVSSNGTLIFATANIATRFYIKGDLNIFGKVELKPYVQLNFIKNQSNASKLEIKDMGILDIKGNSAQNGKVIIKGYNSPINFNTYGTLRAKYFKLDNTNGLSIFGKAKIKNLSYGEILNTTSTSAHIFSEISFNAENMLFDVTGNISGKTNIELAYSYLAAWLINSQHNNNLVDSNLGNILWFNSNAYNIASDFNLDETGYSQGITLGDVNNDAFPDIFLCKSGYEGSKLLINNNGITYQYATNNAGISVTTNYKDAILTDYDNDGDDDLLLFSSYSDFSGIILWKNKFIEDKSLVFENNSSVITSKIQSGLSVSSATFFNLNKDALSDIFLVQDKNYIILQQETNHTFRNVTTNITASLKAVSKVYARDLDNDKLDDIIILKESEIEVLYSNTGSFDSVIYPINSDNNTYFPHSLTFEDLNNDGYPDIILSGRGKKLAYFLNKNYSIRRTTTSLEQKSVLTNDIYNYYAVVTDFNNDGFPDIILPEENLRSPARVFQGTAEGSFIEKADIYPMHVMQSQSYAQSDFNNDGVPDLYFCANSGANELYLTPTSSRWLKIKLKAETASPNWLRGTKVDIISQGQTLSKIYYSGPKELFFNLVSKNAIENIKVTFPSGKIFTVQNINANPTASVIADEALAKTFWLLSGSFKNRAGTIISTGLVKVIDSATYATIAQYSVTKGDYTISVNINISSVKIQALYSLQDQNFVIETPELNLEADKIINFTFPSTEFTITGKVLYDGTALSGILVQALPQNYSLSSEVTKNYVYTQTLTDGSYRLSVYPETWNIKFWNQNQYLISYEKPVTVGPNQNLVAIDLKNLLNDTQKPNISITNLVTNQTIKSTFTFLGNISDNLSLKNYTIYFSVAGQTNWSKIYTRTASLAEGSLGSWNTLTIADNTYDIKIEAYDIAGNTNQVIISNVRVQNILPETYKTSFNTGLHFISSAFKSNTAKPISQFFTTTKVARYFPAISSYVKADSSSFEREFKTGFGYWLKIESGSKELDLTGSNPNFENVTITLTKGWNMLGNPFHYSYTLSQISVSYKGQSYSLDSAISNNLLVGSFWGWDSNLTDYQILSKTSTLSIWKGFWVRAIEDITLTFSKIDIQSESGIKSQSYINGLREQKFSKNNWYLQLILKDNKGNSLDSSNFFGVSPEATDSFEQNDIPEPPVAPLKDSFAILTFPHADWQNFSGLYATDIRSDFEINKTWDFEIDATSYEENSLTIDLGKLNDIEKYYSVRIYNESKNEYIDIKNRKTYTFAVTEKKIYKFSLTVEDTRKTLALINLEITDLLYYPNPFNPNSGSAKQNQIRIKYTLNKASTGECLIYSMSGRLIKIFEISNSEYGSADTNTILWDGKDEFNNVMPNDVYFFLIKIRDDFGYSADAKGKIVLWKK